MQMIDWQPHWTPQQGGWRTLSVPLILTQANRLQILAPPFRIVPLTGVFAPETLLTGVYAPSKPLTGG